LRAGGEIVWVKMIMIRGVDSANVVRKTLGMKRMVTSDNSDVGKAHVKGKLHCDKSHGAALIDAHGAVGREFVNVGRVKKNDVLAKTDARGYRIRVEEERDIGRIVEIGVLAQDKRIDGYDARRAELLGLEEEIDLVQAECVDSSKQWPVRIQKGRAVAQDDGLLAAISVAELAQARAGDPRQWSHIPAETRKDQASGGHVGIQASSGLGVQRAGHDGVLAL